MLVGLLKNAFVPVPSRKKPPPATVVATPPGVTLRTRALALSATYKLPPESNAMLAPMPENFADAPVASR
jgi:hypothetical protein